MVYAAGLLSDTKHLDIQMKCMLVAGLEGVVAEPAFQKRTDKQPNRKEVQT